MPIQCWTVLSVCIEQKVDVGNAILAVIGVIGLAGVYFGYRQMRSSQRGQQTQLLVSLYSGFFENEDRRRFFYRLDYPNAWRFDAEHFAHTDEERHLDAMLYQMSLIGVLVRSGDIDVNDLGWVRSVTGRVLENREVLKYLVWLQSSIPGHSSFEGAAFLYRELYGRNGRSSATLDQYVANAKLRR